MPGSENYEWACKQCRLTCISEVYEDCPRCGTPRDPDKLEDELDEAFRKAADWDSYGGDSE
jgi:hypothetical protein